VRASAIGDDSHVMLDGHDVVAYFTENRHAKGQPQFKSQFQGVTFHFASAAHKALFDAAPQKYLPQYGGFCANGIMYGIPWGGDADTWRIIDGKLYIFGGAGSRRMPSCSTCRATASWPTSTGRRGGRQQQLLAAQQAAGVPRAALRQRRRTGPARGRRARRQALIHPARQAAGCMAPQRWARAACCCRLALQAEQDHAGPDAPEAAPLAARRGWPGCSARAGRAASCTWAWSRRCRNWGWCRT
jgi:YHS domain-containing protein